MIGNPSYLLCVCYITHAVSGTPAVSLTTAPSSHPILSLRSGQVHDSPSVLTLSRLFPGEGVYCASEAEIVQLHQ